MPIIIFIVLIIANFILSINSFKLHRCFILHPQLQLRRNKTFSLDGSEVSNSEDKIFAENRNYAISKVAIIGSGIAGLGLMASLARLSSGVNEVSIFESRDEETFLNPQLGGGIQLSGGASVLEKIGCYSDLEKYGSRLTRILSRSNKGSVLVDIDVQKLIKENAPRELCANNGLGEPMMYSIMRSTLLRILFNATQSSIESNGNQAQKLPSCSIVGTPTICIHSSFCQTFHSIITGNKKCIKIMESKDGKVTLKFADGTLSEKFDLVVGADGASSTAIQFTSFGEANILQKISQMERRSSYSGIRIAYCITPPDSSLRLNGREAFHQWLGDGCYALAASYGGIKVIFLSVVILRQHRLRNTFIGSSAYVSHCLHGR